MSLFNSVLTAYSTKVNGQVIDASDVNNLQIDVTQIENIMGRSGDSSVVGTYEYFIKSPASDGGGHVQKANKGGTGQTSFNKGDVLIAQSSSVLTKLSIGGDGAILTADSSQQTGIKWGAAGISQNIQTFTNTGVWTKPTAAKFVIVTAIGSGGGGGEGNFPSYSGGGGGGGAIATYCTGGDMITSSVLVTVASMVAANLDGTDTTFGTYVTAKAGKKGTDSSGGGSGTGGLGGSVLSGFGVNGGAGGSNAGSTGSGGGGAGGGTYSDALNAAAGLAGTNCSVLGMGGSGGLTNKNGSVFGGGGGGIGNSIGGTTGKGAGGYCVVITYV